MILVSQRQLQGHKSAQSLWRGDQKQIEFLGSLADFFLTLNQ